MCTAGGVRWLYTTHHRSSVAHINQKLSKPIGKNSHTKLEIGTGRWAIWTIYYTTSWYFVQIAEHLFTCLALFGYFLLIDLESQSRKQMRSALWNELMDPKLGLPRSSRFATGSKFLSRAPSTCAFPKSGLWKSLVTFARGIARFDFSIDTFWRRGVVQNKTFDATRCEFST